MPHGKLDVYVEGAVQIKDAAIMGRGSPYCTLTMGTQEFSSPPITEGGTRPYFNTKFQFQVDRTTEQLLVRIFSKNSVIDDGLLGYCTIFFKDAFYHSHVLPVTAYRLTRPSGRPGGHIRLSLTFTSQPRPAALSGGGYMPLQPRPARPARQPRPVRPPQYRNPRPPSPHQQHLCPPRNNPTYGAGPSNAGPPYPPELPRRMDQEDSSQSSRSDSDEDLNAPPPYRPYQSQQQQQQQPPPPGRGRGLRPGPPPGRGRAQGQIQAVRAPAPSNNNNNNLFQNFGGALMQNLGGALVGTLLSSDGDGSNWGGDGDGDGDWGAGGDDGDGGSYGQEETASYGSGAAYEEEQSYYVEEYAETDEYDAAGGPGFAPQPVGVYGGPPARGRGRVPARAGRGRGRRPGPPPGRGRAQGQIQAVRAPAPPNNNLFQNFGGALMQNLGGALVGSLLSFDGDGDGDGDWGGGGGGDWGGGGGGDWDGDDGDGGSYGQVETASYGSGAAYEEEQGYYESSSIVEYAEFDEGVEMSQDDATGGSGFAPQPVGMYGGPPTRGRGRVSAGPQGRAGPPIGRASMMPSPGRGARGRGPPQMARGRSPPMGSGRPLPVRGRAAAPF